MSKFYVDAHFHVWDLDRFQYKWPTPGSCLYRNVFIDEYERTISPTPVKYSVFVQVQNNAPEEAEWVHGIMAKNPFIKGIVAGLDPSNPQFESQLDRLQGKIVGIRHITDPPLETKERWICQESVHTGLKLLVDRGLTLDINPRTHFLKDVVPVAKMFPTLKIVVDHMGRPYIREGLDLDVWQQELTELAKCTNVYTKLSGLVTEGPADWNIESFRPHVQPVLEAFGPDRVMFGSDWPVLLSNNATYQDVVKLAEDLTQHFSDAEKDKIFRTNVIKFYNLQNCE